MGITLNPQANGSTEFVGEGRTLFKLNSDRGGYIAHENFVQLFDDFLGDSLDARWSGAAGSDAQAVAPTISAANGGVMRMTTGDTTTVSESAVSLTHGLNYKAGNGGLYLKARIKPVTSVADVAYFVGFTDTLATSTLEIPITLSGTTLTTTATDAVGFVFDTAATNDYWHCQGVKADTDTALINTSVGPSADTYQDLEIVVDSSGTATFYINGAQVASVANAVTTTVSLTPVITAMARTTTSKSLDADYIFINSKRA